MNQSPAPTNRRQTSFRCKERLGKITLPTDGVTVLRTDCTTEVRRRLSYSHFLRKSEDENKEEEPTNIVCNRLHAGSVVRWAASVDEKLHRHAPRRTHAEAAQVRRSFETAALSSITSESASGLLMPLADRGKQRNYRRSLTTIKFNRHEHKLSRKYHRPRLADESTEYTCTCFDLSRRLGLGHSQRRRDISVSEGVQSTAAHQFDVAGRPTIPSVTDDRPSSSVASSSSSPYHGFRAGRSLLLGPHSSSFIYS